MKDLTDPTIVDPDEPVTEGAPKLRDPTSYEKRLRTENQTLRQQIKDALAKVTDMETRHPGELAAARTAADTTAAQRVIAAEVRAAAVKAGMVDLDGVKLLDLSTLTMGEDGTVPGIDAILTAAKEGKPYLFGTPIKTTTVPGVPPKADDAGGPKHVRDMTDAERSAAMKTFGVRLPA